MKHSNLSRLFVLVMTMHVSLILMAQQNENPKKPPENSFQVRIRQEGTTAFRLIIDNPSRKKLDISIVHTLNGVASNTITDKEIYNCRYDFEAAEDGRYQVIVASRKEKFRQEIELNTVTTRSIRID